MKEKRKTKFNKFDSLPREVDIDNWRMSQKEEENDMYDIYPDLPPQP